MSIVIRAMQPDEADGVAVMFRQLPVDLGQSSMPRITGQALLDNADIIHVLVAVDGDELLGACSWVMTFSTWRAVRGMYCCDLYVGSSRRGLGIGERLLRAAAVDAAKAGAGFIKLEASLENSRPGQFYGRLGFHKSDDDGVWFLETEEFGSFIQGSSK